MADWFRCQPLPLLDALQDVSDDAGLVFTKALLLIYHRDGRIAAQALRSRFPNWRPKRLARAVQELIDGGKLIGTTTGDLHNGRAMHELEQLGAMSTERAAAGGKGGRVRAERERLAKKIAERNVSPDLFEPPAKPAANPVETRLNRGSTPVEPTYNTISTDIENDYRKTMSNEINGSGQAQLKHAPAIELETELEIDTPFSVPPTIETLEGEVIDQPTNATARKQPLPPGWLPTRASLSDRVQGVIASWPNDEVDEQAIKFLEWAEANTARFTQWDRAFGNWCMKHHEQRKAKRHGKSAGFNVPDLGQG